MAGGINPFVYAHNNPVNYIDPLGLFPGGNNDDLDGDGDPDIGPGAYEDDDLPSLHPSTIHNYDGGTHRLGAGGPCPSDKWSRLPKSTQDQMVLKEAKKGAGRKIIDNLNDSRFKGMEKWEYKVKSANGRDSVVHYVRDPRNGKLMDFKFKKHSHDTIKPLGNVPSVKPGE